MKQYFVILSLLLTAAFASKQADGQANQHKLTVDLFGDTLLMPFDAALVVPFDSLSNAGIQTFFNEANKADTGPLIAYLTSYKEQYHLNDWFYYQLIRKTANAISPKTANYYRYTLYKWLLLTKSGYDATIRIISENRLLFYVRSDDNVYNIPYQISNGKQYVCLNYHDYDAIDPEKEKAFQQVIHVPGAVNTFSYRVTRLPLFGKNGHIEKDLHFTYQSREYNLKIKLNPAMKDMLANYPVVDFESCFNIPLSTETYTTLIPGLKGIVEKMDQKKGIDFLMHFTRYAFLFQKDTDHFGKEKRLAPQETLLYDQSDCEDRAALFFYLVKELYDLPMITLLYPQHVTIAVAFPKPSGRSILYNGKKYTVCEPTPQAEDLDIGQLPFMLRKANYDIGYEYLPARQAGIADKN